VRDVAADTRLPIMVRGGNVEVVLVVVEEGN